VSTSSSWVRRACLAALVSAGLGACLERGDRWAEGEIPIEASACEAGDRRCAGTVLETCVTSPPDGKLAWLPERDCSAEGRVCAVEQAACAACEPDERICEGAVALSCSPDGSGFVELATCDEPGTACREGNCEPLCALAASEKSNVGCTYWAVDLDNASLGVTRDAASQQFAVVVSNPQPDVRAHVRVFIDDAPVGEESAPFEIASADVPALDLRVFSLGPREVDGTPEGEHNTGTHTALSRAAFRIESDVPVVAYQFNPLENVDVFSNDASLLVPQEALGEASDELETRYVALSWPQTIAITDDPDTNFDPSNPTSLRTFLTIVGTRADTRVRVTTAAAVVPGGPVAATPIGGVIEATVGAFEVLNLETEDFGADFTGSIIDSDAPIAVFVGGEASDAPHFETLAERFCCADHLEEQLTPTRTAGTSFAIPHSPSRTKAIAAAGVEIEVVPEPDFVRFVATTDAGANIRTTLEAPNDLIRLEHIGSFAEVEVTRSIRAVSDEPILVAQIMASQAACGVRSALPGGDPSLLFVPPIEQAREENVFLTPDKYAFDFLGVVARPGDEPLLDGIALTAQGCTQDELGAPGDEDDRLIFWECQLGFPVVDDGADPVTVDPADQNDGVHRVSAGFPVVILVSGFDAFVSYAYAAGTQLREIAPPR
jgi:hypothetical protein